ncbi:hypothetical protein E4T56_gene2822 [Termitomyces sp. T112]|nr:hypothetical protein E4T56_gene2822 [Termitomyces sp. T112]
MPIPSITEVFLCKQVEALTTSLAVQEGELRQAREDRDMARIEKEANGAEKEHISAHGNRVSVRGVGLAGASDADGGAARGGSGGAGASSGGGCIVGRAGGGEAEGGLVGQQGRFGACWVQEHWVLLDGASMAFTSIQDGLMQGSTVQPPELQQGMAQLERLLVGHRRRNAVAPGLWWEVAADAGEALPGLAEVLAVVQAQMEVNLGVGLPGGLGRE